MRRRRGEVQIFSLSMLDVIAGALGAFLIVVILLLPYYKKESVDFADQIRTLEGELARVAAAAAASEATAAAARSEAEAAKAEAEATKAEARTLRMTDLDLVLAMDTTGSMHDAIDELKANLDSLIRLLRELTASLRVGFVAYRDHGELYTTRDFPLTPMDDAGYATLSAFIRALDANGGGDAEEAVDVAIEQATAQPWRAAAHGYIVMVGDAPAHAADAHRAYALAEGFAAGSVQRHLSVIAVGGGEEFFRKLAEHGKGTFISNRGELYESLLVAILKKK
jgi:hypothetical protein